MRMWVGSLAWLSGLRIRHCRKLWYRLQTWAWELPYASGVTQKRKKKKKKHFGLLKYRGSLLLRSDHLHPLQKKITYLCTQLTLDHFQIQ